MKEYPLSFQYALIGLDGLDSLQMTAAKRAVLRGIEAARLLENLMKEMEELSEEEESEKAERFEKKLEMGLKAVRSQKKQDAVLIEKEIVDLLQADGSLDQVQDLLACDINYDTAGVQIKAYRTEKKEYLGITEWLRAEVLEEGSISRDAAILLWLCRESGCVHDLFSAKEQMILAQRAADLGAKNSCFRCLWQKEFHSGLERFAVEFLKAKRNLFKNPYLEGVNLQFPFLERRQAIFIDFVVFGTSVAGRRVALLEFLTKRGHYVEEIKYGKETLLKIDNAYYRVFPKTISCNRIPIQGANLVPVYF